jgi:hypothetical protein
MRGLSWARVKFSFEGNILTQSSFKKVTERFFKPGKVNVVLAQIVPDRYFLSHSVAFRWLTSQI